MVLAQYGDDTDLVWCQEEHRNMGAWPMMDEWLLTVQPGRSFRYVGRPSAAASATGNPQKHRAELERFITQAFEAFAEGEGG